MSEELGEFQQRPKVQEAVPIPLRRRKPTGWIIATFLFAIIAIGAITYIIVDKTTQKKEEITCSNNTVKKEDSEKIEDEDSPEDEDDDEDDDIVINDDVVLKEKSDFDALISGIANVVKDAVSKKNNVKIDDKNVRGAYIKVGEGIFTTLDLARSVSVSYYAELVDEMGAKEDVLEKKIKQLFAQYGLRKNDSVGGSYLKYFESKSGAICQYTYDFSNIVCGHKDWISRDNKALVTELWESYSKKKEKDESAQISLIAKISDIKNSTVDGYKRLTVSEGSVDYAGGAMALFYKKGNNKWQYIYSTQNNLFCEQFKGDAAKAFTGVSCYDNATGKTKTIGL